MILFKKGLEKYFRRTRENKNSFMPPATDEQVTALEKQLGIILPVDYKTFLKFTNGFDGFIKDFYAVFEPVEKVYESTKISCAEFFPWAIFIGSNANVEMFVIDTRKTPYQFGLLPFIANANDFIPLGDTFEKFVKRLYYNTAFKKR